MNFDAVIISEDKYLTEAVKQEMNLFGLTCGTATGDIGDGSVVICDASLGHAFSKIKNDLICIFPSETSANMSEGHTVFIKPFLMEDLVRAVLGLKYNAIRGTERKEAFSVNISDTFLIVCGKRIDLTRNEMLIFTALWENKGNAVGREHLDRITRANSNGNMVTVYINRLREKLASVTDKKVIVTVRDKGYMIPEL